MRRIVSIGERRAFPLVCLVCHGFFPHRGLVSLRIIVATFSKPWLALTCGHGTSWDDVLLHSWGVPRVFTCDAPVGSPILLSLVFAPLIFVISRDAVSLAVALFGHDGAGDNDETPLMPTTRTSETPVHGMEEACPRDAAPTTPAKPVGGRRFISEVKPLRVREPRPRQLRLGR